MLLVLQKEPNHEKFYNNKKRKNSIKMHGNFIEKLDEVSLTFLMKFLFCDEMARNKAFWNSIQNSQEIGLYFY